MDDDPLTLLHETLQREMPICAAMAIRPVAWDGRQLSVEMPLDLNRNHQYSAFAGSLNALCTIAGWGAIFLLLHREGLAGNIVIRRSQIRYSRPVRSARIVAQSLPLEDAAEGYFFELLRSMGQSKVDVSTQIADADGALVAFSGSYVIQN